MDVVDRAGAALLGMAVGEALGAPLEGLTTEEVLDRVGHVEGYVDARKVQPRGRAGFFQAGVYEDETQIALVAADVLVRSGGFSPATFRDRLEELGQPIDGNSFGAYRRARRNFRIAVRRMLKGAPWTETGVNTAGSGAASRGVPIGIYFRDDRPAMLKAAVEAALVTHLDPRGAASAAAVAAAVAHALKTTHETIDVVAWCKEISDAARDAENLVAKDYRDRLAPGFEAGLHQLSDALLELPEWTKLDIESAFARIIEFASKRGSRPITSAVRGFALTGVVTSFWFYLTGLDSYEATVSDAVSEGGSSDTVGCITGALLGALHGTAKIPPGWLEKLKNRDQIELRGRILGGAPREGLKSLLLLEAALTKPAPKQLKKERDVGRPPQRGGGRDGPQRGGGRGGPPRGGGGGRPGGRFGGGPPRGRPGGRPFGGGGRGGPPRGGGGGGRGGPPRGGGFRPRPGGPGPGFRGPPRGAPPWRGPEGPDDPRPPKPPPSGYPRRDGPPEP